MTDLIVFLRRCLDEDEAVARAAAAEADANWNAWETALRLLAVPFADRPGYDESWRPS